MSATKRAIPLRHVIAVFAGNGLEFYDFLTFSYFSDYIGRVFFPSDDRMISWLAALATFGVGFLMRPVGAFVIGRMGDRIGRKPAMLLSFSLMGVGIIGMCLTPSYARIGFSAPVLVVLFACCRASHSAAKWARPRPIWLRPHHPSGADFISRCNTRHRTAPPWLPVSLGSRFPKP